MSESTPSPVTVFIPERSSHVRRLLEVVADRGNHNPEIILFGNHSELDNQLKDKKRACIVGELSRTWSKDGLIFEGINTSSIHWPPVYCALSEPLTAAELTTLGATGVIWAAEYQRFIDHEFVDLLISGNLWTTRYGLVYQKLARKSIEFGDVLVVLTAENGHFGRIQFLNGNIVAAQCGDFSGFEALYAISLISDWRIDVHTRFISIEPKTMNSSMLAVVEQLVELVDDRGEVFLMARPPGSTREIPSNLMAGYRSLIDEHRETRLVGESTPGDEGNGESHIVGESVVSDSSVVAQEEEFFGGASTPSEPAEEPEMEKTGAEISQINQEKRETGTMSGANLQELISMIPGAAGGAVMESDGACLEVAGDIEFETAPVVASMALEHLADLARVLGVQGLKVACFSGEKKSVFITRQSGAYLFTTGGVVKNAGVVAGKFV